MTNVPLERWIKVMIGGFKTVSLASLNEVVVIGYTWLFVYECARSYKGRMNAVPLGQLCRRYFCDRFL